MKLPGWLRGSDPDPVVEAQGAMPDPDPIGEADKAARAKETLDRVEVAVRKASEIIDEYQAAEQERVTRRDT